MVQARVHLALPEDAPLAEQKAPASASVFIKYRPGTDINGQIGKIKALVVNSIEGLKYENVSVETFAAAPAPVAVGTPAASAGGGDALVWALAIGALAVVGALAYPGVRRWRLRRQAAARRAIVPQDVQP